MNAGPSSSDFKGERREITKPMLTCRCTHVIITLRESGKRNSGCLLTEAFPSIRASEMGDKHACLVVAQEANCRRRPSVTVAAILRY